MERLDELLVTMRTSMMDNLRSHPTKWASIAAGAGFGLGILGRMLRDRRKAVPHLVIIEAC